MSRPMRVTGREFGLAAAACLGVVLAWVALTAYEGAFGIPRNDDWSFILNAFNLHDTGTVAVTGWAQMLLIGQSLAAYPVLAIAGNSVGALQLLGAAFGLVLLVSSYLLARTMLPVRWAALSTAVLAVGPLFGTLAVSFMTDIPSAAMQVLTVYLGVRALQQSPASRGWLVAAGVAGVLAFSIREYSVIALGVVAILLLVNRASGRVSWRFVVAWLVAVAIVGLALVRWRAGQVTENPSDFGPSLDGLRLLASLPLTLGLLVLPAVAFVNPLRLVREAWRSGRVVTLLALALVTLLAAWSRFAFLGNYWSQTGPYSQSTLGEPPLAFTRPIWWVLTGLALLSAYGLGLLAAVALSRLLARRTGTATILRLGREEPGAVASALFVVASILLVLVLASLLQIPVFDRYFVAVVAPTAAVALWVAMRCGLLWQGRARAVGVVALGGLALVGVVNVSVGAARDGAKWALATAAATDQLVAPGNIDGGFEWFNFQTNGVPRPADAGNRWTWWTATRDNRAVCATVLYAGSPSVPGTWGPDPAATPLAVMRVRPLPGLSFDLVAVAGPDTCG